MTEVEDPWHEFKFVVQCSVRYHMRRRRFFERWSTLSSALSVVFGSATVSTLLSADFQRVALWTAAAVTAVQILDLVIGTSRQAWIHGDLYRRFLDLEAKATLAEYTPAALAGLKASKMMIDAEEPPALRVLWHICYNEVMRSMGYEQSQLLRIPVLSRWLAHYLDFGDESIRPTG